MFNDVFDIDGININYRVGLVLQSASRARVSMGSSFGSFRMSPDPQHMKIKVIPKISAIKNSNHNLVSQRSNPCPRRY